MSKSFSLQVSRLTKERLVIAGIMLALIGAALWYLQTHPITFKMYDKSTISYAKGTVLEVEDQKLEPTPYDPKHLTGSQQLKVKIDQGSHKGEVVTFENVVGNTHALIAKPGDDIVVQVDAPQHTEPFFSAFSVYRGVSLPLFFLLFMALVLVVGGRKGVMAMIGLVATVVIFAFFLIPAIFNGGEPVLLTVGTVSVCAALSLALLNGLSAKTAIAVSASLLGVAITVAGYYLFAWLLNLNGYNLGEAEELLLVGFQTGLQVRNLLFCCIVTSALGAIMDMTMSIATALCEFREHDPSLSAAKLFNSGMNMGKDMVGTMTQTLLFALMGASFVTMLVLVAAGTQPVQLLNSDYLAIEVFQGLLGSMAVVLTVPITSGLSAIFLTRSGRQTKRKASKKA